MSVFIMSRVAWLLLAVSPARLCYGSMGRPGHGFVGYGIPMYNPVCPYACRAALSGSPLNCSTSTLIDGEVMTETSTSCYATDAAFLGSMAWCLKLRCTELKAWHVEKWWQHNIPGKQTDQPDLQWTYQESLDEISSPPITAITKGDPLNVTVAVSDDDYHLQATSLAAWTTVETNHSKYGYVVAHAQAAPRSEPLTNMTQARAVDLQRCHSSRSFTFALSSSTWHSHHEDPCSFPGQSTCQVRSRMALPPTLPGRNKRPSDIHAILVINTVLCIVGYPIVFPHAWWKNRNREFLTYVTNRAGVLSFANIAVLVLYAGRNNLLLWITDWESSTFVLLHSCVAWICTIQAVLHSIIYLRVYVHLDKHSSEAELPYWYWGIIATLCLVIMLPGSAAALRRKAYELFLASHFALALLALVGCYLHIVYKFDHQWGYELWIYIAFAIWGLDRLLRILRVARHGVRTALISKVDENYFRVDVAGVKDLAGDGTAYLYFPTLSWRFWENHPFSVTTTFSNKSMETLSGGNVSSQDCGSATAERIIDLEGDVPTDTRCSEVMPAASVIFFIKVCNGTTSLLRQHRRLPVLVESGYASRHKVPPSSFLLCIAGGVGITAVIPTLQAHRGMGKLYWSCRSSSLVDEITPLIKSVDKVVAVGMRHDIRSILADAAVEGKGEMIVLVSGPESMRDGVREVVCIMAASKLRRPIRMLCEIFS